MANKRQDRITIWVLTIRRVVINWFSSVARKRDKNVQGRFASRRKLPVMIILNVAFLSFVMTGLKLRFPSATGSIIYAILQIVITGVGAALINKAGRKPLLLVSGSRLVAGCIFTAVAFYLKETPL
ncbi:putative major facilitator, sugar transporter [Medicago truncatula]|uniref:Putative major facilitator, sugar transporter n=1 Tax=Medicago truncatula TaxID=3880 RepID=A0A396JS17_MEDTR|nr:putative major facilitator, sugar transporter [Medicago truncatula]